MKESLTRRLEKSVGACVRVRTWVGGWVWMGACACVWVGAVAPAGEAVVRAEGLRLVRRFLRRQDLRDKGGE